MRAAAKSLKRNRRGQIPAKGKEMSRSKSELILAQMEIRAKPPILPAAFYLDVIDFYRAQLKRAISETQRRALENGIDQACLRLENLA